MAPTPVTAALYSVSALVHVMLPVFSGVIALLVSAGVYGLVASLTSSLVGSLCALIAAKSAYPTTV